MFVTSVVFLQKVLTVVVTIHLGVKEQIIFPEISIDKVNKISGMDITFVTTAKTDEESYELLKAFGCLLQIKINNKAWLNYQ